jgi:hypothetical protein
MGAISISVHPPVPKSEAGWAARDRAAADYDRERRAWEANPYHQARMGHELPELPDFSRPEFNE